MEAAPAPRFGFRPERLAARLADAWQTGLPFGDPDLDTLPAGIDEAYAVQRLFDASIGGPTGGYKLGLSSPQALSGAGRPVVGIMPSSRITRSGEELRADGGAPGHIEIEVAFRLSRPLRTGDENRPLADFVERAVMAFEIARSRFTDWKPLGVPALVADRVAFHRLVTGVDIEIEELGSASAADVALLHDGRIVATAAAAGKRVNPEQSMRLVVPVLLRQSFATEAGMLVTTGNLASNYEAPLAGTFEGWLGDRRIECTFVGETL